MAERDRRRIAAVLAADAQLQAIAHLTPAVGRDAVEQTPERRQVRHLVAQLVQAEQVGERARGPELAR